MVHLHPALGDQQRKKGLRRSRVLDWFDLESRVAGRCRVGDLLHFDLRRSLAAAEAQENLQTLAAAVDQIEKAWGAPCRISAGFAPEPFSRSLGRPANCLHGQGLAVDLVPACGDLARFHTWLAKRWSGGLVRHPGSVHLDLRNRGRFSAKANLRPTVTWLL